MNFFFMLTLILIIMVFIKMKIPEIPSYAFFGLLVFLLVINEVYNFKFKNIKHESFTPLVYDGAYDKYFLHKNYIHQGNSEVDNVGLMCSINKNMSIKKIQDNKFSEYKDFMDSMNNVVYGSNQPDSLKMPDNFGDITEEQQKIEKINNVVCPPVCHLIENESDCNNAVDIKEVLKDNSELETTKPVFDNKRMMRHAYECLKSNPCNTSLGCKEVGGICIYDKKKCFYDTDKQECRQRCDVFETRDMCPKDYCNWNNTNLKCEYNPNTF